MVWHPATIRPCIRAARTTTLQSKLVHVGQTVTLVNPLNPSSIPEYCHISGIPGWAQKEVAESQRSGLAALGCGSLWPSLVLPIWWFNKAGEYLFPGRKCPHLCERICWWQMNGFPTHHGSDVPYASPLFLKFLAWAFAPELNEHIQSFNSWPLFSCQWLPDQVT